MPDQTKRIMHIQSPLGDDRCAVSSLSGVERVNELFSFTVSIIAEDDPIKPYEILGEEVTVTISHGGVERPIHGLVANFAEVAAVGDNMFEYDLEVVPRLWQLCLSSHTRIFEEKSALDIVKAVVAQSCGMPLENATMQTYRPRETCIQYAENDLQFVTRLLAEEGIAFFFKHRKGSATLVLTDGASSFPDCSPSSYPYSDRDNSRWRQGVSNFRRAGRLATGEVISTDYSEYAASSPIDVKGKSKEQAKLRPGSRKIHGRHDFERKGPARSLSRGACADQAQRWSESLESDAEYYSGDSGAPSLVAGHNFSLSDAPVCSDGDTQYLAIEVRHSATDGLDRGAHYANRVRCAPSSNTAAFLPAFTPERPRIWGVQVARVVEVRNPKADGAHGEVKVRFPWAQEAISCWARVGQLYAGNRWGGYFVPDLDQEVLVEFINGDPDRPVVVGAVYNQDNPLPPYTKWQSGIRTRSSDFNELRFDDNPGAEEVYFQAGKDHKFLVKNDEIGEVANNQSLTVGADQSVEVSAGQTTDIGNSQQISVGQNHELEAGQSINLKAGMDVTLEANTSITLKVGGSELKIDQTGVTIKGTMIKIAGNAATEVSGSAMLSLKGGLLKIN